jgi:GNAT superfamily N-acetyltransferase
LEIELITFNTKIASESEWKRFHKFRRIRHFERSPEDPLIDDKKYEKTFKLPATRTKIIRFTVIEKGKPETQIAQVYFSVYKDRAPALSYDLAMIDVSIIKEFRNRGFGKQLFRKISELARKHGKFTILSSTSEKDGKRFIKKIGGTILSRKTEYRLKISEIDWALVDQWIEEGIEKSPKTFLKWFDSIPEEMIEDYCNLYTIAVEESPHWGTPGTKKQLTPLIVREDELKFKEQGGTWLLGLLQEKRDDDDNPPHSALTEIKYLPSRPEIAIQFITLVKNKYRGYGKGKWIKAAMLKRIKDQFPAVKCVVTGFVEKDSAMFYLNNKLGFKLYRESITASMSVDDLDNYLNRKNK